MPSAHDILRQAAIDCVVAMDRYIDCDERPRPNDLWQKMTAAKDHLAEVANVYPLKGAEPVIEIWDELKPGEGVFDASHRGQLSC